MGRLQDKVAIITGSGGSIGRAAALAFAREGARIVGCDVDTGSAEATRTQVSDAGGRMVSLQPCDLGEPAAAQALVDLALSAFGRVDIVYNNAARAYFEWLPNLGYDTFRRTLRDELDLVFHLVKAAWPHLIAAGSGAIVNTASVSGMICYEVVPGLAHSTAKAGVLGMTRHLAMEGAPHGIRANAVSPGLIVTQQTAALIGIDEWRQTMERKLMLKRIGRAEDVAAAALFLASDEAAWITGINLPVDGGTTAW
jgi:NAD(P)-dependent dehydrogenase (short-subunit alcohol dehydrogenase family)